MDYKFEDYEIKITKDPSHEGKLRAFIEEFYIVFATIDDASQASDVLRPLFDKQVEILKNRGRSIPAPGSGRPKYTFAATDKIEALRPFVDEFFEKVLGTSYATSFVSNESTLPEWADNYCGGKENFIERVKAIYGYDITSIYDRPLHEVLSILKTKLNK